MWATESLTHPHLLPASAPPDRGAVPNFERVFITATYAPSTVPRRADGRVDVEEEGPKPVATMVGSVPAQAR